MPLELDGFLWKPKPGTTVTAEEFVRARSVMRDIHRAVEWNPWVQEDRAEEYAAALEVIGQWTRPEPGYRPQSPEELRSTIDQQVAADRARGPGLCPVLLPGGVAPVGHRAGRAGLVLDLEPRGQVGSSGLVKGVDQAAPVGVI
jgi:hypothetical protein